MRKIEEMFAFAAEDVDGDEGIMALRTPANVWVPLVGSDMARVDSLRPIADAISRATGIKYKLLHFKLVSEIE
jgi:hypothetical protein